MGAFTVAGADCNGDDILAQLNAVFGFPHMRAYKYAKEHNKFGSVPNSPGNYNALIDAYDHAGLEVTDTWRAYLRHSVRFARPTWSKDRKISMTSPNFVTAT